MIHLVLATRNRHKTSEFASFSDGFALSDLTRGPIFLSVEETGRTFEENAILKAVAASRFAPRFGGER